MFDKETLEKIYINVCNRDINSYNLAIIELHERIDRLNNEFGIIRNAIDDISTFGNDYEKMTEQQQYTLGAYVNLMNSSNPFCLENGLATPSRTFLSPIPYKLRKLWSASFNHQSFAI